MSFKFSYNVLAVKIVTVTPFNVSHKNKSNFLLKNMSSRKRRRDRRRRDDENSSSDTNSDSSARDSRSKRSRRSLFCGCLCFGKLIPVHIFLYLRISLLFCNTRDIGRSAKRAIEGKGVAEGGIRPRKYPRDLFCLIIFIIFWIVLLGIALFAFFTGNPKTLATILFFFQL